MQRIGLAPTPKVAWSAVAGAATVIIVWACGNFWKVVIPPEVAAAITLVIQGLTGYLTPEDGSEPQPPAVANDA